MKLAGASEAGYAIVRLSRDHHLLDFDCGNAGLDEWLKRFAWINQQADSSRTYVATDQRGVAGYFSLAAGSVQREESPRRIAKGLAHHPVGVVVLARLAVDRTRQARGLGKALLFDALSRIDEAAGIVGVRAVLVHAIDERARAFYLDFGFEESPLDLYQLMLLLKDLRRAVGKSP